MTYIFNLVCRRKYVPETGFELQFGKKTYYYIWLLFQVYKMDYLHSKKGEIRSAVYEAYHAAMTALCLPKRDENRKKFLICCMVSGGIYSDKDTQTHLKSKEHGYGSIIHDILENHQFKNLECCLVNFRKDDKKAKAKSTPVKGELDNLLEHGRTNKGVLDVEIRRNDRAKFRLIDGDSISVADMILEENPNAKVSIMIAGNAGRPFGSLGKMDTSGFEESSSLSLKLDLKVKKTSSEINYKFSPHFYNTQEEDVLAYCLQTLFIETRKIDRNDLKVADVLYNYVLNGNYGDEKNNIFDIYENVYKQSINSIPNRILVKKYKQNRDWLSFENDNYTGECPWGMLKPDDENSFETKQGFNFKNGCVNDENYTENDFQTEAYHFCFQVDNCFINPKIGHRVWNNNDLGFGSRQGKLRNVSFSFVYGPNTQSVGTLKGAQARTVNLLHASENVKKKLDSLSRNKK